MSESKAANTLIKADLAILKAEMDAGRVKRNPSGAWI